MHKLTAFIFLICHVNFSMFLPQGAEVDAYDKNGRQLDDINSLIEYVEVVLGYDHTADDEDDDSGQNFHAVKAVDYLYEQKSLVIFTEHVTEDIPLPRYLDHTAFYTQDHNPDVPTPPPDISA